MVAIVGWQLTLVNAKTGVGHATKHYSSKAQLQLACARYAAEGYEIYVQRKDTQLREPQRYDQKRSVKKDGTILVDVSQRLKPTRPENDRFYKNPDEYGGADTDPSKLKRATKRSLSASWSKGSPKVMPRRYADPNMVAKDHSSYDPSYQLGCLRAKLDRVIRQAANHLTAGRTERYAIACSAIADLRGHIAYLCYKYPDVGLSK